MGRILVILLVSLISCNKPRSYTQFYGETMGTYYRITFQGTENIIPNQTKIDSILVDINNSHSTYIKESTISRFNQSDTTYCFLLSKDSHFLPVFLKAKEVYSETTGYFDPTIGPLVNYWGFGYNPNTTNVIDNLKIKNILTYIDFKSILLNQYEDSICISKNLKKSQLDFSAIAKGYAIDVIANYLDSYDIHNYLIDIGGESRAKGINQSGKIWTLGINKPTLDSEYNEAIKLISLKNKSIASSGNYRNYKMVDNKLVSHIIDPKDGFFKVSNVLSATVIADNCMEADAFATALMLMPPNEALKVASSNGVECFLILKSDSAFSFMHTEGMSKYLKN